ncbi:MAG: adenylate/guanylate cyclase domain-containing protein [Clostridia bacterium]|nr:adenylate/guanylate cyclase domain-containing protein [Clostridia bacterium]
MKTSTKILIVITILLFIPNLFLTKHLLAAVQPTGDGFVFNFTPLAWVALALQILFNVFFNILFFRFLKTQRLTNVIFFSVAPLTLVYGVFMVYIIAVKNLTGVTAESVRATLNITTEAASNTNYLWAGLATLVYLILLFVIVLFACRPLSRVEAITQKLGDGRMKFDDFKVGGGKQFKEIENSLNKINYNYKEKENKLRQTNLEAQKFIPKQFFKFLGKSSIEELELGNQVKKNATTLFCDLKSATNISRSLSLEENFNYINSYIKVVAPLVRRYDGFIDKYMGDGVLAVFAKPQDAIECAHAILRAIEVKNKSQKELPAIDARLTINTGEIIFGIVGDEDRKSPTIISDVVNLASKMEEINLYIGTKLLISKSSLNELPQNYEFDYRYTGALSLDDGSQIPLFESLNYYPKNKKEKLKKLKSKFESGVRAYNERNYQQAKETFEYVLHYVSDDKPAFVYFNKSSEKLGEEG